MQIKEICFFRLLTVIGRDIHLGVLFFDENFGHPIARNFNHLQFGSLSQLDLLDVKLSTVIVQDAFGLELVQTLNFSTVSVI